MENAELVVIGAGWYGLAVAKTYLESHPATKLVILDSQATLGGVWAKERLYPGLKTNNMLGTFEYSDFPMDDSFGVRPGNHIPGPIVHEYLHRYAESFDIYRRIRFRSQVVSVERQGSDGWLVTVLQSGDKDHAISMSAQKLVVATGLTSQPVLPEFNGSAQFVSPLFHCKDLPKYHDSLARTAKSIVVLGGTKFAWDTVYAFASSGVRVDWVIRRSGHGPAWMAPPYVTPFRVWLERLVTTRCLTWFSPCVWGDSDGFGFVRRILHRTRVGRWIVDRFWNMIGNDVLTLNGYDQHRETAKLKPWSDVFWIGNSLSILNYPTDFFEYVRNGTVKIHIEDISALSAKTVHLSSGQTLNADALVCSTGWHIKPSIRFLPEGIESTLGIPCQSNGGHSAFVRAADEELLSRFPRLRCQPRKSPVHPPTPSDYAMEPYRLYRAMVSPAFIEDRSIAFSGALLTLNTPLIAQTQALWLTAYLGGMLSFESLSSNKGRQPTSSVEEQIQWETILHSQYGKWRCPEGRGRNFPDIVFDAIPYIDILLRDLGLKSHRKGNIVAECFQPYTVMDYRGLIDEWRAKNI